MDDTNVALREKETDAAKVERLTIKKMPPTWIPSRWEEGWVKPTSPKSTKVLMPRVITAGVVNARWTTYYGIVCTLKQ